MPCLDVKLRPGGPYFDGSLPVDWSRSQQRPARANRKEVFITVTAQSVGKAEQRKENAL